MVSVVARLVSFFVRLVSFFARLVRVFARFVRGCHLRFTLSHPVTQRQENKFVGFEGTAHALSFFVTRNKKRRFWAIGDEEREVLLEATMDLPALRAVVSRGSPAVDLEQALKVHATVDEFDDIYTLVEAPA